MHWFFVLAGAALAVWSAYDLWRGWRSTTWPAVDGEVLASTVRERRGRGGPFYVPEVRYRYVVGGEHTGRRLRFGVVEPHPRTAQEAYDALRGLDPGARVPVYYDPRNPRRSVLLPGCWRRDLAGIPIGLVFVWVGTQT